MGGVVALLGCAAAVVVGAPALLPRTRWSTKHPATALILWCAAFGAGLLAAAMSLVLALWVGLSSYRFQAEAHSGAVTTTVILVFCWAGLVSLGALLSVVMARSEPLTERDRQTAVLMTVLVGASTYRREVVGGVTVLYVRSDRPVAMSLPGGHSRVVVTSRLEAELSPGELRAVVEHERAHLVFRHGRIVQLARLNASCVPALPAAREFHRAARLLVELIADDVATRACGRDDLAQALTKLAALTGDAGMLLRARRVAAASTVVATSGPAAVMRRIVGAHNRARPAEDGDG